MRQVRRWLLVSMLLGGCVGEDVLAVAEDPVVTTGEVRVLVDIVGNGGDADGIGYRLYSADTSIARDGARNGEATTFPNLRGGSYSVTMNGLAPQCAPRLTGLPAELVPGATLTLKLTVHCIGEILYQHRVSSTIKTVHYLDATGEDREVQVGGYLRPLGWAADGQSFAVEQWSDDCPIWIHKLDGTKRLLEAGTLAHANNPRWSPDGKWMSAEEWETCGATLYLLLGVYDNATGERLGYVPDPKVGVGVAWSPDSKKIAYFDRGRTTLITYDLFEEVFDTVAVLGPGAEYCHSATWSPRGTVMTGICAGQGLYVISTATGAARQVLPPGVVALSGGGGWSPDGSRFAFGAAITGRPSSEIFFYDVDADSLIQFTKTGGADHTWSGDGNTSLVLGVVDGREVLVVMDSQSGTRREVMDASDVRQTHWRRGTLPGDLVFSDALGMASAGTSGTATQGPLPAARPGARLPGLLADPGRLLGAPGRAGFFERNAEDEVRFRVGSLNAVELRNDGP